MLKKLTLTNFKCFSQFTLAFTDENVLVGPNNAGKSTIVSALRVGAAILGVASRRKPTTQRLIDDDLMKVFPMIDFRLPIELENVRHDFRDDQLTVFRLDFDEELSAIARWEAGGDPDQGYFYIQVGDGGGQPANTRLAKAIIDRQNMNVVPGLRPLEVSESVLSSDYVTRNIGGRLSSSHFRNQLSLLQQESAYGRFRSYVEKWMPEIALGAIDLNIQKDAIDVYYHEGGRDREVCWAGDGVQVFLQILLHLFRSAGHATLVLDEPEVYLHQDLQQRLIGALRERGGQVVMATHSSEIIAVVPPNSLSWVDKSRRGAVRLPSDGDVAPLISSLGSVFNLRLARLLRTKTAFFVEGDDLKLLGPLGNTLQISNLDARPDLAIVPLQGSSNWRKLEAFDWVAKEFLRKAVAGFAVFDRDFHTEESLVAVQERLKVVGIKAHIWSRHEIENYLVCPSAIARLIGCDAAFVDESLTDISSSMREDAIASTAGALAEEGKTRGLDHSTVFALARAEVDRYWEDRDARVRRLSGKALLRHLNEVFQKAGYKAISTLALAMEMRPEEIDPEVASVLREVLPGERRP